MAIRSIVFDMGGVLVADDKMEFCKKYADSPEDRQLLYWKVLCSPQWQRWDRGTITARGLAEETARELPDHLKELPALIVASWHDSLPPIPGMEELVRRLKKAGYGIYLLSNNAVDYHDHRERLPARECFDGEFISADYQLIKPDAEIYERFLREYGLVAGECLFLDDREENVLGARAVGMKSELYPGSAEALASLLERQWDIQW